MDSKRISGVQSQSSSFNTTGKAESSGKFNRFSVTAITKGNVNRSLDSAANACKKKLSERVITKIPEGEVKPMMKTEDSISKKSIGIITEQLNAECNKKISQPNRTIGSLSSYVKTAKKSLNTSKGIQKTAGKLVKYEKLSVKVNIHEGTSNNSHEFLGQAKNVSDRTSDLVNERKSQLKKAETDLKKFAAAKASKKRITLYSKDLARKVIKIEKMQGPKIDNSLAGCTNHHKKLIADKRKLKKLIKQQESINHSIVSKEIKHGYSLGSVSNGLKSSIGSARKLLSQLEKSIRTEKLLIESHKLSMKKTSLELKQSEVNQKIELSQQRLSELDSEGIVSYVNK